MDFVINNAIVFSVGLISTAAIFYKPYFGLLIMAFMTPLEVMLTFSESFTTIKALGIITFTSFVLHHLLNFEKIKVDFRLFLPLCVFVFWITIRVEGNFNRLFTLIQLVTFFVMTTSICYGDRRRIDFIFYTFIIGNLLATFFASLGYLAATSLTARAAIEGQNANLYANITGISILLLFFLAPRIRRFKIPLFYGTVLFLSYGMVISSSRGAIVALFLSIFMLLLLHRNRLRSATMIVIMALFVGTGLALALQKGFIFQPSIDRIQSVQSYQETTLVSRFEIWDVGLEMIMDNFIIGVGLDNFPEFFNKYQPGYLDPGRDPHSTYLSIFAETGAIGFLIFLWLAGTFSFIVIKANTENKVLALCILVFIAVVSAKGTLHSTKFFWISLAFSYLMVNVAAADKESQDIQVSVPETTR